LCSFDFDEHTYFSIFVANVVREILVGYKIENDYIETFIDSHISNVGN